jgi:hypothetical protein
VGQKIDISEIEAYGPPPPSGSAPSRRSMLTGQAPPPPSDEVAPPPVKPAGPRSLLSPGLDALQDIIAGGAKEIPREAINILKNLYNTVGPGIGENIVSAMTGRPVPSNPVRDTVLETIGLPTARVPEPKPYGTYDEALQQTNLLQKGGGLAVELYGQSRIPGGRAITGGRVLRRVKTAAREGVIGGLTGVASSDDPITGSVGGTIGGLVVPGRTGQQLGEAAEAQVRAAAQRASQAIAPATKANKRWVARNWEQTVRQSRWFGGLEDLVEQAEGNVRAAGQRIDAVLAGVRQGNVSPQLRRAAAQISMGARALLTRAGTLGVELAPQTREAMENVVGALSRMNPRSTSLEALTAARDELTAAMRGLRGELGRRSAQITGAGAVRQAFDTAVTGGTVQGTRNLARLAQRTMRNVQRGVAPSRIRTQPLVNSLLSFRRTFEGVNDAGQAITHNAPGAGQVDDLIDQVRAYGSEMSVDQVRNVRQIWDKITAGATGKGFLSDIADESRRGATRSAANVVRGAIANQVPALVAPNRAFSFNRNLADVVGDTLERRTGQTKGPMAGVQAGIGTAIGSIGSLLMGLDFGGAGVAGASVGALLHYGTKLVKSPTFNLLNAKTRLAVAEAMRRGDTEALRFALRRAGIQLNVIAQNGEMPISTSTDMTDEEYQQQLQQLQTGGETLPGMSEEGVSPDDIQMPLPPNVSDPLGGDPLDPTQIDSTDLNPGEEEARAAAPEILRAGVGGGNLLQGAASLLEPLSRPVVDIPEWEGHPTVNKIGAAIEQNLTPLDLGFVGSSLLRPLAAGTRFAKAAEVGGRALSGAVALQGAAGLERGIEERDPAQMLGGAMGLGFGGLGMRAGGPVAGAKTLGGRVLGAVKAGGMDVAAGPAVVLGAQALANSDELVKLIPDPELRATVASGLSVLGVAGGNMGYAAMAYKRMTPVRKALVHIAGDLSEGRSVKMARARLTPMLRAHFQQQYPEWDAQRVAAKVSEELDSAVETAQTLMAKAEADSGRRLTDVPSTERAIDTDQAVNSGWYNNARAMVESHIPAPTKLPVDPATGLAPLTEKQHFALEALAAFGTNTPPADNYKLYKRVADVVAQAPDDLDRAGLMNWLRERVITVESTVPKKGRRAREIERVFGMDKKKPGIPALRAMIEGEKTELGGRKIESYFHNLAQIQRENAIGNMIEPTTNDRWILRAMGLPTEVPLTTGELVPRRGPTGEALLDPTTGEPMIRGAEGGSPRQQPVVNVEVNAKRQAQMRAQLLAAAEARAKKRGTPLTARELAKVERDAEGLARQYDIPTLKQRTRSTSQGSEYVSQKTIADVGYEMAERNVTEAARRRAMSPVHAQATLWFREKFGSDLFGGRKGTQGLPLDQQQILAEAGEARLAPVLAGVGPRGKVGKGKRMVVLTEAQRRKAAEKLLKRRDTKLGKEITKSIEDHGGATYTLGGQPRVGEDRTAVSIFPERQLMVPPAARDAKKGWTPAVVAFMQDNADLLRNPEFSIGGWVSSPRTPAERRARSKLPVTFAGREVPPGTLVLDIVATPSRAHNNLIAKTLGMEFNQFAVFDLLKKGDVSTGGMSWQPGTPHSRNLAAARRPEVYARQGALDPAQIDARIAALEADTRLSPQQQIMLKWWKRQRARQQRQPAAAAQATGTEGEPEVVGRVGAEPTETAAERAPKAEGGVVVRRSPDYRETGTWHVRLPDGRTYPVYKDTGGVKYWHVEGMENLSGASAATREELIQKLTALDERGSYHDKYTGMKFTRSINEALNDVRKRAGLPEWTSPPPRRVEQPIEAWHGSPADFEKFSMEKIGTGEGAQVYSRGLYFGGKRSTGEFYRDALTPEAKGRFTLFGIEHGTLIDPQRRALRKAFLEQGVSPKGAALAVQTLHNNGGDLDAARSELRWSPDDDQMGFTVWTDTGDESRAAMIADAESALDMLEPVKPKGKLYNVKLHVEPDELIDWDAPIEQQPEKVKTALAEDLQVPEYTVGGEKLSEVVGNEMIAGGLQQALRDHNGDIQQALEAVQYDRRYGFFRDADSMADLRRIERTDQLIERLKQQDWSGLQEAPRLRAGTGKDIFRVLERKGLDPAQVVEALKKKGVQGVQYFDRSSRKKLEGSRNYVIYDDDLIEIAAKLGIPLALVTELARQQGMTVASADEREDTTAEAPAAGR